MAAKNSSERFPGKSQVAEMEEIEEIMPSADERRMMAEVKTRIIKQGDPSKMKNHEEDAGETDDEQGEDQQEDGEDVEIEGDDVFENKPDPLLLAQTGWHPLGPYHSKSKKGKADRSNYEYFYMQFGKNIKQRITYKYEGKAQFEKITQAYEAYRHSKAVEDGKKGAAKTNTKILSEEAMEMPNLTEQENKPFLMNVIAATEPIQRAMLKFGRDAFLLCIRYMDIPEDQVMDVLMQFDDGDKTRKNMLEFLQDCFQKYQESDEVYQAIDELQKKLNSEIMKRTLVEDTIEGLKNNYQIIDRNLKLAFSCMNEQDLRTYSLARVAQERGLSVDQFVSNRHILDNNGSGKNNSRYNNAQEEEDNDSIIARARAATQGGTGRTDFGRNRGGRN